MSRNIFAFTAPGASFPEYISVNRPMPGQPDGIEFTVRGGPGAPTGSGYTGQIVLDRARARELGLALIQATN